jgi:predicted acylesterase/phospholipase RssA
MAQSHPTGWRPAVWYGPQNIHYLSFQGGGGKGIAYVGAIEWLEKSLDQKNDPPQPLIKNPKIKGLSGASAGAITALLVTLGYGYQQLQWLYSLIQLSDLVDDPEYGTVRCVSRDQSVLKWGALGSAGRAATSFGTVFEKLSSALLDVPENSLVTKLLSNPGYWGCLLYDGGMLSGINLRGWLGKRIRLSPLWAQTPRRLQSQLPQDGTKITFQQLRQMGGSKVDLAVVATNLITGRPMVFAPSSTPKFPVADAVAMSASLPPVFKPVWVSSSAPLGPSIPIADYVGWYVDGGVVNNVPIHVFDQDPKPVSYDPYLDPAQVSGTAVSLNEYVLGLLLSPGDPVARSPRQSMRDPDSTQSLGLTLGQLIDALQFGANIGQLRSQEEGMQTVLIYTDGVGLVDFVPQDPGDAIRAQQYGFDMMNSYYTFPPRPSGSGH